ncbi:PIN domain-containing protein [Nostoc sp.]|uniref:PIN domain-containing protein n=1 Tax=Nostoc sp. TaxID=1180 RepID=UPI002FF8C903
MTRHKNGFFLEAEAVLRILAIVQMGNWRLQGSETFDDELRNTPEGARKRQMQIWAALAINKVNITPQIAFRGAEITQMGFKDYDALHIACAETSNADVLLTTDDRMLRLAARYKDLLQVRVENPLQWLREVANDRC